MYPPSGTFGPYDGPQKPYDGDEGKPFLIINFVKNREDPDYGNRPDLKPEWVKTGNQADQYYGYEFYHVC